MFNSTFKFMLMKKFLLSFPLLLCMLLIGANAMAKDITTTFTGNPTGTAWAAGQVLNCEEGGLAWVTSGKPNSFDTQNGRGIQFSKTSSELTTTVSGNVTKVTIVASSNTAENSMKVSVGGTSFGETAINKSNNETYEFTSAAGATGEVKISLVSGGETAKSIYVKTIILTFDGEGSGETPTTPTEPAEPEQPSVDAPHISIAEFLEKADTDTDYELTGVVTEIANTEYGNLYIEEDGTKVYIYGVLDKAGQAKNFASLGIKVGSKLTVVGRYTTYKDAPQIKNAQFVKVEAGEGPALKDPSNTEATAYTVSEIVKIIADGGYDLTQDVFVKGTVVKVDSYNSTYGSITYWISEDGTEAGQQFEVYGGLNFEGAKFASQESLAAGDVVVVKGKVKKYQPAEGDAIFEFDKNNILVSKNGKTTDDTPTPEEPEIKDGGHISIAEFLEKADTNTQYELTGVVTEIVNTTYGNLYIKEGDAQIYIYGVLDLEGAAKNFESLNIEVGDMLTIKGIYTTYKDAPQIKNAQFVKVEKDTTSINALRLKSVEAPIFDLSGRRVSKAVKGLYIQNGKKVLK